ncbi:MAG: hypothetical protein GQ574_14335 [Crocinitomix sp.]|nr:hypothetical protein [Crocinitomix sp.]
MLKLFKRKKEQPISKILFNNFGWHLQDNKPTFESWVNDDDSSFVSVEYFDTLFFNGKPKIDLVINKIRNKVVQDFEGGIIECEAVQLKKYKVIQIITKEPQKPSGMSYIGRLIIPTFRGHYMIMIKLFEIGTTGMREAAIFPLWMKENPDFKSDENGKIIDWLKDPFDPEFRAGALMNYSEQEVFDKDFPEHPLSDLRQKLILIQNSLEITI